jgi:hypothetical protein
MYEYIQQMLPVVQQYTPNLFQKLTAGSSGLRYCPSPSTRSGRSRVCSSGGGPSSPANWSGAGRASFLDPQNETIVLDMTEEDPGQPECVDEICRTVLNRAAFQSLTDEEGIVSPARCLGAHASHELCAADLRHEGTDPEPDTRGCSRPG